MSPYWHQKNEEATVVSNEKVIARLSGLLPGGTRPKPEHDFPVGLESC